jgi:hypothetical protein
MDSKCVFCSSSACFSVEGFAEEEEACVESAVEDSLLDFASNAPLVCPSLLESEEGSDKCGEAERGCGASGRRISPTSVTPSVL